MKTRISCFIALFLICSIACSAQEHLTDFAQAKELATQEGKNILMVFSGSDWCKPCIMLKKDILEDEAFASFKNNHLVHLELDFPYKKKNKLSKEQIEHNEQLAEIYNSDGAFPKILVLDSKDQVLTVVQYKKGMTVQSFIDQIKVNTLP